MQDLFFYLFAALTLLCAFLVVVNPFSRNPVTSAMFLVLTIVSMAGLFVLLHAFFLAAVQSLVYAGAVMVLFLFVIMLLDLKEEAHRKFKTFGIVTGLVSVGARAAIAVRAIVAGARQRSADLKSRAIRGVGAASSIAVFPAAFLRFGSPPCLTINRMISSLHRAFTAACSDESPKSL